MRATRRSLMAENTQLKAQLASTKHETRKELTGKLNSALARNADLVRTIQHQESQIAELSKANDGQKTG